MTRLLAGLLVVLLLGACSSKPQKPPDSVEDSTVETGKADQLKEEVEELRVELDLIKCELEKDKPLRAEDSWLWLTGSTYMCKTNNPCLYLSSTDMKSSTGKFVYRKLPWSPKDKKYDWDAPKELVCVDEGADNKVYACEPAPEKPKCKCCCEKRYEDD